MSRTVLVLILTSLVSTMVRAADVPHVGPSWPLNHGPIRVSEDHRYLVHEDGAPFFYLADTGWELFHKLNREDAEYYLENRRAKGFTAIQAAALAELNGLNSGNPYGQKPLFDNNPEKPNDKYFEHVDWIVNKAREKGIMIMMLPTWGDKVNLLWGTGPVIFTNNNLGACESYGRYIGNRYRDKVMYMLGGDRPCPGFEPVWRAMAKGIALGAGDGDEAEGNRRVIITYHSWGGGLGSAECFTKDEWLDTQTFQSSHFKNQKSYDQVTEFRGFIPTKPCLNGENIYEGKGDANDNRQQAYWDLLAGAMGHTYGYWGIWNMSGGWKGYCDAPGGFDMHHVRRLFDSRPLPARVPDQSILTSTNYGPPDHIQAMRGDDYVFVYSATGKPFTVALGKISGQKVTAWWYDPREGTSEKIGEFDNTGTHEFTPKSNGWGKDWLLVLDDASKGYAEPGTVSLITASTGGAPGSGGVGGRSGSGGAIGGSTGSGGAIGAGDSGVTGSGGASASTGGVSAAGGAVSGAGGAGGSQGGSGGTSGGNAGAGGTGAVGGSSAVGSGSGGASGGSSAGTGLARADSGAVGRGGGSSAADGGPSGSTAASTSTGCSCELGRSSHSNEAIRLLLGLGLILGLSRKRRRTG